MAPLKTPIVRAAIGALIAAVAAMASIAAPQAPIDEVAVEPVVTPRRLAPAVLDTLEAPPGVEVSAPAAPRGADAPARDLPPLEKSNAETGHAGQGATVSKSRADRRTGANKAAAQLTSADPPMWRLTDADSEIFFVGTFHALPRDVDWRSDALALAADKAHTVVFEAEVDTPRAQRRAQEIVVRSGRNKPGVTLSKILGPDVAPKLAAAASGLGIDPAALEPLRPWQAFLALSIKFLIGQGFDPGAGLDQVLLSEARLRGRSLRFFETVDQQMNLFAGMSPDEEKLLLETTLREWDDQPADVRAMLAAWQRGDLETIDMLMNGAMRDAAPGVYDRLIVARNRMWADRTEELIEGSGTVLIAVGAAHLAGADSLPAILAERGHDVVRWPPAAPAKPSGRR